MSSGEENKQQEGNSRQPRPGMVRESNDERMGLQGSWWETRGRARIRLQLAQHAHTVRNSAAISAAVAALGTVRHLSRGPHTYAHAQRRTAAPAKSAPSASAELTATPARAPLSPLPPALLPPLEPPPTLAHAGLLAFPAGGGRGGGRSAALAPLSPALAAGLLAMQALLD